MWWILPYLAWVSPVALLWWFVLADNDRPRSRSSPYSQPAWYFPVKRLWALVAVRRMKAARAQQAAQPTEGMSHENFFLPTEYERHLEEPRSQLKEGIVDSLSFHGADFKSNSLVVRMTRMRNCLARLVLQLKVGDSVFELPHMPDTLASNTGAAWTAGGDWGGLRIEVVEPLRRWRIAFNGVLREGQPRSATDWDGLPGDQARLCHVRFNFLWHACSGPYNCRDDWSASLLADTLAREPWQSWPNSSWMDIIEEHVDGYDQYGILHGEVKVKGGEPQEVYLRGLRQRRCGPDEALSLHRKITISGVVENGVMFTVGATCHPGHLSHATYGHIRLPDGQLVSIDSTSLSLEALAEDRDHIPKHFVLLFTAGGVRYTSALHVPQGGGLAVLSGRPWSWLTELRPSQCSLEWADRGVLEGVGVVELGCRYDGPCPLPLTAPAPLLREVKVTRGALVLSLTDDACRSSPLVGGKGSSLAALTALLAAGDGDHDALYSVPAGFCLTVTSLERQLAAHPALRRAVDDLAAAAASSTAPMDAALAAKCEAVVALFAATPICEEVAGQVRAALQRLEAEADAAAFTQRESSWAVRSSAVGEDSDELSAAGQNETFLGCRGADGVLDGVRRCWASLFALQSVQYRRQYAQPVDAPMAVVVQRMVQAHCAGVLFTCDPASGDPRRMLITANYGLGESVVSAAVDPDVLVVRRDMAGQMHVEEKRSGGKQHRIVLSEHGGVREEAVADASAVCLSDGEALRLARAGARLERAFGGARDVEWAFADGRLHLLQSRPVTALFNWTEFELLHEMDSPSPSDEDVFTTANASEVLPGASSPLCESTTGRGYEMSTRGAMDGKAKYYFKNGCTITHHHLTINVLALLLRNVGPTLDTSCQVRDLALCGHSFTTPRMHRAALKRNGCSQQDAFTKLKSMMQSALLARRGPEWVRIAQAMQAALDVHELAAAETTSRSVLKRIAEALPKLLPIFGMHNLTSAASSFSQVIAMNVLAEGAKELSNEHITDVAVMLTCTGGDVTSAGIPTAMKEIAAAVRRCPNWKDFVEVAPEDGIAWLQNHCTDAHTKTLNFLKKYGNRVVREFDVATVTWEEQPDRMMATLQPLVASGSHEAPNPAVPTSLEDTINKLKSPKRSSTRFILRYLLPWFQRCVVHREFTKEAAVRAIHKFRLAFRRLGLLLEKEGRLPDRTLANFLTFWELYRLAYEQPDPSIVDKARRRKRFWPEWDALVFAEALHGPPKPLRFDSVSEASPGSVVAQGTPASESSVTARACVVLTLEGPEIKELRAGDVLITHATDVGWSPFFPMLGGVVTEMGGLISHGAVVAREYGLPCLVGVQGATRMFKTGDMVRIDGKTGKVFKIE